MSDWKYFTDAELCCSCCQQQGMNNVFMQRLSSLRRACNRPYDALRDIGIARSTLSDGDIIQDYPVIKFYVASAYRCANHPIEAAKVKPGAHSAGRAVDIRLRGKDAWIVATLAPRFGMTGLGFKQKGNSRFIHMDDTIGITRPWIWSY